MALCIGVSRRIYYKMWTDPTPLNDGDLEGVRSTNMMDFVVEKYMDVNKVSNCKIT